jgi:hypothetical protein
MLNIMISGQRPHGMRKAGPKDDAALDYRYFITILLEFIP